MRRVNLFLTILIISLASLITLTVIGVAVETAEPILKSCVAEKTESNVSAYESVLKTLTDEERKVVEVLGAHGGKYLQKYVRKEAELSRVKTHRIVARLAERGIVSLEKTGNTNQVLLAD